MTTSRHRAQQAVRALEADAVGPVPRALPWLVGEVPLGATTLEVGRGWATPGLALVADRHLTVGADARSHDELRRWCKAHDIALDRAEVVTEEPTTWLPQAGADGRLVPATVDLVVLAGAPVAPLPTVAWFHAAPLLRDGGLLALEHTGVRAVADLLRLLVADRQRWSVRHRVHDAVVLQRRGDGPLVPADWRAQPGNVERRSPEQHARALLARARRRGSR